MESFLHTLKVELVHQCRWARHAEARQALFGYIEGYYTRYRMPSALGYLTPEQAEENMTANPRCPRNRGKINWLMSDDLSSRDRAELLHGPNLRLPIVLTSGTNESDVST